MFIEGSTTIFTGLCIFIFSQCILEFYIKPRVLLRKLQGDLSQSILFKHSKWRSGSLSFSEVDDIQLANSKLLSQAWVVYKHKSVRNDYVQLSQLINLVISNSRSGNPQHKEIVESIGLITKMNRFKGKVVIDYNFFKK
jgi:hypothetical protein